MFKAIRSSAMSLMKVLMGENSSDSILLFSRVGALTQLELNANMSSIPLRDLKFEKVALKIIYDYTL